MDHHLGNAVLSLPVVRALAAHFECGVDLLVDERYGALARGVEGVGRVIEFPAQRDGHGRKQKPAGRVVGVVLRMLAVGIRR